MVGTPSKAIQYNQHKGRRVLCYSVARTYLNRVTAFTFKFLISTSPTNQNTTLGTPLDRLLGLNTDSWRAG